MAFQDTQNPGIGGLKQLTTAEQALVTQINSLGTPGSSSILGYDTTDGSYQFFTIGSGLTYTHSTHTLSAGGGSGITIGSTAIASGTTTKVLFDNAGVVGEYTISGTGNVAMTTSPVFTTPNIGVATGSVSGNAGTATALATGRTIAITGDIAYTSPAFDGSGNVTAAGTLATVNTNVGSFTNANITVNGKGLITAASNGSAGGSAAGVDKNVQFNDGGSAFGGALGLLYDKTTNITTTKVIDTGTTNAAIAHIVGHTSSGTAAAGFGSVLAFSGQDAAGTVTNIASITASETSVTAGSITSKLIFTISSSGMLTTQLTYAIGSLSSPSSPDLGITSSAPWGNLFMASTKKIDFANGDVVLTHSTGILTIGTGTLKITTPTNTTTSVVTIDGTQTLTNKSIAIGQLTGFGTGVVTALAINVGSAGAFVTFNGALGTPSSGTGTNITAIPAANILAGTFGTGSYTIDTQLTVKQIVNTSNAITATSNAATVPITSRISTVTNSSAATLTITITTASAVDGQLVMVRILDFSAVAQTLTFVNTENSTVTVPTTSNGSTTLPLTVGFQFNALTTKWRCVASA